MNLATARQQVATALSTVNNVRVSVRPVRQPRTGDGWVVINRITPSTFSASNVTFTAVVLLGPDEAKAEELFEDLGVDLVDAATSLNVSDVSLEAQALVVGTSATPLYALALTLTMEVD